MARGIMTETGRRKFCMAHAGDIELPRLMYMAFGNGGVDSAGNVIGLTGKETALRNELARKVIGTHSYPVEENTTCRYTEDLEKGELSGQFISEMGLFDEEGDLIAYNTFLPKGKDSDMRFIFDVDEIL